MTEEQVTKNILLWLKGTGWHIVCFDFPQSGTGRLLHPDSATDKNKHTIKPDIIAVKGSHCAFFENKNRFCLSDYKKQNCLITNNEYIEDINRLLWNYRVQSIYYGIGMPSVCYTNEAQAVSNLVDFILGTEEHGNIKILYNKKLCPF